MSYEFLMGVFGCTIWFTPFTFVFFLVAAIKKAIKDENYVREGFASGISLLLILIPMIVQL